MPFKLFSQFQAHFSDYKHAREIEKSEAAKDFYAMAASRRSYAPEYWKSESERLLKKAVGKKWGLLQTREEKALGEYMLLQRNELLKTEEMKEKNTLNSLMSHPLMFGLHPNTVKHFAKLNSGGREFVQIQQEGNGFSMVWRNDGKLESSFHSASSAEANELRKLFANSRGTTGVVTAKMLGLEDQISLKQYIESKYKLKWDKKLEQRLSNMSKLVPAYAKP